MSGGKQLDAARREFFGNVARAVVSNPFGEERPQIDREITGIDKRLSRGQVVDQLLGKLGSALSTLDDEGVANVEQYASDDRRLLELSILFDAFHRFAPQLDELIAEQVAAGPSICTVPFARDVIAALTRRGFADTQAIRCLGLIYQLRRAFYFIDRGLIGCSPSIRRLRESLWDNTFTTDIQLYERYLWDRMEDFSTLILGETGTGKGTAAAAIGRSGFIPFDERKQCFAESFTEGFVSLNLSQFPEALIESELFGHRKGAFTGAVEDHEGVFERCSPHGSIFLDEIGDVAVPIQIKLLQVLQERVFSPVGSHEQRRFRGRVIAATNQSVDDRRRSGAFRDDFFYRLSSDIIVVPPLRQRLREDPRELDLLLGVCMRRILGDTSDELVELVKAAIDRGVPKGYPWPGNVRELEQCIRRVLLTGAYRGDQAAPSGDLKARLMEGIDAGTLDARGVMAAYCQLLYRRFGTYEEVARRANLDRRTVKKHVQTDLEVQPRAGAATKEQPERPLSGWASKGADDDE